VNYDIRNWKLISEFLNSDRYADISVLNRALLLDDALNLARVGLLRYQVALNITKYLSREDHYLPWKAAFSNLDYIARMLRLTDALGGCKVSLEQWFPLWFENPLGVLKMLQGVHGKMSAKAYFCVRSLIKRYVI
jgi:hypothetical protein